MIEFHYKKAWKIKETDNQTTTVNKTNGKSIKYGKSKQKKSRWACWYSKAKKLIKKQGESIKEKSSEKPAYIKNQKSQERNKKAKRKKRF